MWWAYHVRWFVVVSGAGVLVARSPERAVRAGTGLPSARMCVSCLSNAEAVAAGGVFAVAAGASQARVWLSRFGIGRREPFAREARTVDFLRGLELDPVRVLGAEVVNAVEFAQAVEVDDTLQPVGAAREAGTASSSKRRLPSLAAAQ